MSNPKVAVLRTNPDTVMDAFKGEDLNHYVLIFRAYDVPVRYNFEPRDMRWVRYEPKAPMLALDRIYPEGIYVPDFFFQKNIVHLPSAAWAAATSGRSRSSAPTSAVRAGASGSATTSPAGSAICSGSGRCAAYSASSSAPRS